jgi:hypothetical protein
MNRKGVALPPELLRETLSYVTPMSKKPYPGHEQRLASARRSIAKERQEKLTARQMQFIQELPLEDQAAAYAALGGKSKRKIKRSNKGGKRRSRR